MLLENENKDFIKELSTTNLLAHKKTTLMIIIAIILTTVLLSGVMTAGYIVFQTLEAFTDSNPAPEMNGSILGYEEQLVKIRETENVNYAVMVKEGSISSIRHPAFIGMKVPLLSTEESYYQNNRITLAEGKLPTKANEIFVSDTFLKRAGILFGDDTEIDFNITVLQDGEEISIPITFNICGYFHNPLIGLSEMYEEVFVSESFLLEYNPEMNNRPQSIYVQFKEDYQGYENQDQLQLLMEAVGGLGISYKTPYNVDPFMIILPVVAVSFIIMTASYLIIYNIFNISLVNHVKYWGKLKTIGTTGKQIKKILNRQVKLQSMVAIPIGLLLGYLFGILLAPILQQMFTDFPVFDVETNPIGILLFAGLFAYMTVKISCRISIKLAMRISPIDSSRYEVKSKKQVFTILSLTLAFTIFTIAYAVPLSYDLNQQVSMRHLYDITFENETNLWGSDYAYQEINKNLAEDIKAIPDVTNVEISYNARSLPDFDEYNEGKHYKMTARIKNNGSLKSEFDELRKVYPENYFVNIYENDLQLSVLGISQTTLEREIDYIKIKEGSIDPVAFAKGNYLIYNRYYNFLDENLLNQEHLIHAGDKITLEFFDNNSDSYLEKEFTVMAVTEIFNRYGAPSIDHNPIILSEKDFAEIYPDYESMISHMMIDTKPEANPLTIQNQIKELMTQYNNYQIIFRSKYNTSENISNTNDAMILIGIVFSIFIGSIGMMNLINTFTMEVMSNRLTYGKMQAIGMTKKQLFFLFVKSNCTLCGISILASLPISFLLSKSLCNIEAFFNELKVELYVQSVFIIVVVSSIICVALSFILVKRLNKETISNRLREEE